MLANADAIAIRRRGSSTFPWYGWLILAIATIFLVLSGRPALAAESEEAGLFDPDTGIWYLRSADGSTTRFFFGNPGDTPFMGDWNCDGVDTPGLYRRSDGFVYLRNSNTQGVADIRFFFGNPGDVPVAGDFDNDGCDSVSIYRPPEQRFYIINRLGSSDGGLGAADFSFMFGNPGDVPFVGDFDDDGFDTVGLHRRGTGVLYFTNDIPASLADSQFFYGVPGDIMYMADWNGDGRDTVGVYRPVEGRFYLRNANSPGPADHTFPYGARRMIPLGGLFGSLPGGGDAPPRDFFHVSSFTTFHGCCQNRVHNIQLMARTIDGTVIPAGGTFSINALTGARTQAKGYLLAPAIIGGEYVNVYGGGVSQFGTTAYNAFLFGGYDEISHRPHSVYISRYPACHEATLGTPSPDVVFVNDTDSALQVRTSYTSTSITVSIYGNNEGRRVQVSTSRQISPSQGGSVSCTRRITFADGRTESETWFWTYRPS
ncbi:MAG TPA: VanW family protein [Acidimicrobiia bacterium]|nr:VanW family protein [Acidimicrobiia bacterium]